MILLDGGATGIKHAALHVLSKSVTARVSRQQLENGKEELQVGLTVFQAVRKYFEMLALVHYAVILIFIVGS